MLPLLLLLPLSAGLLSLALPSRVWWERVNLAAFAGAFILALRVAMATTGQGSLSALNGALRVDALSAVVISLTAFVALLTAVYAVGYFRCEQEAGRVDQRQLRRYYILAPLFVFAMLLVPMADNLGVMWVSIESATLASVLLVTFYNRRTSFEAGWKYIIIGGLGIALALFGTVLAYSSAARVPGIHADDGMKWSVLVQIADRLDPKAMRLAFVLVLLGYGTKAGLAPMHTWKPDAYAEAPVPAAALLAAAFLNCAVYAIMRFHVLAGKCLGPEFSANLLVGFGVFSILLAAPFVLVQRNFRRLLAYSSIDHAGIMVAALGFGGRTGALAAVFHMVFHALAKPLLFFAAGNVQQHFGSPFMRKVRGVMHHLPLTATVLLLATFAVTGVPPFSLFQSEFLALNAALAAGRTWAASLFVLGVVTVFCGFLVHAAGMNFGPPEPTLAPGKECRWKGAALVVLTALVVAFSIYLPAPMSNLMQESARIITIVP